MQRVSGSMKKLRRRWNIKKRCVNYGDGVPIMHAMAQFVISAKDIFQSFLELSSDVLMSTTIYRKRLPRERNKVWSVTISSRIFCTTILFAYASRNIRAFWCNAWICLCSLDFACPCLHLPDSTDLTWLSLTLLNLAWPCWSLLDFARASLDCVDSPWLVNFPPS